MEINRLLQDLDMLDYEKEPYLIGLRLIVLNAINVINKHRSMQPGSCHQLIRSLQDVYRQIPVSSSDCDVHDFNQLKAQVYDSLGQFSHQAAA